MTQYCKKCEIPFEGTRCPACGRKSSGPVDPYDLCFLTEKEALWEEMIADALTGDKIPFVRKNVLGAALALKTGPMRERVRFYVFFCHLPSASELVEALFAPVESEEEDYPEERPENENGI